MKLIQENISNGGVTTVRNMNKRIIYSDCLGITTGGAYEKEDIKKTCCFLAERRESKHSLMAYN